MKFGDSIIFVHHGYGKMSLVKLVKYLNTKELSYMDWNDLSERAWKAGARQYQLQGKGVWYIPKRKKK